MAIDVCYSEISSTGGISPRISFSSDLNQTDDNLNRGIRLDSILLDSGSDFDFCIGSANSAQQLSSADELFSNGKILPVQIKKQEPVSKKRIQIQRSDSIPSSSPKIKTEKKRLKELLLMSPDSDLEEKSSSKSFWQFKRSVSLNHERTRSKGLIRSLHFLSRSNSTGSAPNPKPNLLSKETHQQTQKQKLQKKPSVLRKSSSVSSSSTHFSYGTSTQKPQLKKGFGAYNGNGIRVSPVLNFPPPSFISNATVGLFGISSFFCSGKIKRKTR